MLLETGVRSTTKRVLRAFAAPLARLIRFAYWSPTPRNSAFRDSSEYSAKVEGGALPDGYESNIQVSRHLALEVRWLKVYYFWILLDLSSLLKELDIAFMRQCAFSKIPEILGCQFALFGHFRDEIIT